MARLEAIGTAMQSVQDTVKGIQESQRELERKVARMNPEGGGKTKCFNCGEEPPVGGKRCQAEHDFAAVARHAVPVVGRERAVEWRREGGRPEPWREQRHGHGCGSQGAVPDGANPRARASGRTVAAHA
eukprot:319423-Prymnesium_polylepis.1